MPSPDIIKEKLIKLPVQYGPPSHRTWKREENVWEGHEKGTHFHFYRMLGEIQGVDIILSLSGTDKSKTALLEDFRVVLGEPRRLRKPSPLEKKKISYFEWIESEIQKKSLVISPNQ